MKKLYIPHTLSREILIEKFNCEDFKRYAENNKFIYACLYFIHILCKFKSMRHTDDKEFVNLSSKYLEKIFVKNPNRITYYKNIITALHTTGIIEINGRYSIRRKIAKGFKLSENYEGHYKIIQSNIKKVEVEKIEDRQHYDDISKLTVDIDLLNKIKEKLYYTEMLYDDLPLLRYLENDHYSSVDTNMRVYSNFINVSKIFRGCLKYNDEILYTIDITNAHPFFLIKLLLDQTASDNGYIRHSEGIIPDDVVDYINCVCHGNFVTTMAKDMRITFDYDEYLQDLISDIPARKRRKYLAKEQFKENLFAKIFFNRYRKTLNPYTRSLKRMYRNVWTFVNDGKKVNYKLLSNQLNMIESNVMNNVLLLLRQNNKSGIFIRLHDCIVTTAQNIENTENAIRDVSYQIIGYRPSVTTKKLSVNTDDILRRDKSSSIHKVFEQYEMNQLERKKFCQYCKQYRSPVIASEKINEFTDRHFLPFQKFIIDN